VAEWKREAKRKRERGTGGLYKRAGSKNWYLSYYDESGRQHIESSKTAKKSEAQSMLTSRLEGTRKCEVVDVRKLRYEDIRTLVISDYRTKGKLVTVEQADGETVETGRKQIFKALDEFFANMPVYQITTQKLRSFVSQRMEQGISGATCNRNLALLRRMFTLAIEEKLIQSKPKFPMQKESDPREGFEFEQIRPEMPANLHPYLTFAYETGCRPGATKQIVWPWVHLADKEIHLPARAVKNRYPLILPLSNELVGMLKKLFQDEKPVFDMTNFRKAWEKACVKVGQGQIVARKEVGKKKWYQYKGLIPYDFRRSAARNLIDAGVDETAAMKITGHKTNAMFRRYNIVSTEQLHKAMGKVEQAATRQIAEFQPAQR
jgi:integrase